MYLVAGLGNPGGKYSSTRHNLGFRVADALAERSSTRIRRREFSALTAIVTIGRSEVLLLEPQTYMNRCGPSVHAACGTLGISADHLIVVYDDVDLPLGRLRVRSGGSAGGHRGVASIIETSAVRNFVRVRLGIGRPPAGVELADWVLQEPSEGERQQLEDLVVRGADAVTEVITGSVDSAMRKFNGASPESEAPE
jgi:PTH1 family peptidyl-tRNA hydrolase